MNKLLKLISFFARKFLLFRYRIQGISIGKGVFISWNAKIDTTYKNSIVIEDGAYITYGSIILAHDHTVYRMAGKENDNGRGFTRICKNSFVGAGSIVLRNITIGENSIVAAGSVVTKNVPDNCIVAGNPATIIKTFTVRPDLF